MLHSWQAATLKYYSVWEKLSFTKVKLGGKGRNIGKQSVLLSIALCLPHASLLKPDACLVLEKSKHVYVFFFCFLLG